VVLTLRLLPWILLPRRSPSGTRRRYTTTVRVFLSSPVSSLFSALPRRLPLVARRLPLLLVVPRRLSSPTTTGNLLLLLVPRRLPLVARQLPLPVWRRLSLDFSLLRLVRARVAAFEAGTGAVASRTFPVVPRTPTVAVATQTRTSRRWTNDAYTQTDEWNIFYRNRSVKSFLSFK
jgi:hypothetical protein